MGLVNKDDGWRIPDEGFHLEIADIFDWAFSSSVALESLWR